MIPEPRLGDAQKASFWCTGRRLADAQEASLLMKRELVWLCVRSRNSDARGVGLFLHRDQDI